VHHAAAAKNVSANTGAERSTSNSPTTRRRPARNISNAPLDISASMGRDGGADTRVRDYQVGAAHFFL
jgi:hypothetical protein